MPLRQPGKAEFDGDKSPQILNVVAQNIEVVELTLSRKQLPCRCLTNRLDICDSKSART